MINQTGFVLNVMTLIISILTCLVSFIIFVGIVYHLCYDRIKKDDKITIIHCVNIYGCIFVLTVVVISFNIQTLLGDLYQKEFNSSICMVFGIFFTGTSWYVYIGHLLIR